VGRSPLMVEDEEGLAAAIIALVRSQHEERKMRREEGKSRKSALWESRAVAACLAVIWALLLREVYRGGDAVELLGRNVSKQLTNHLERIVTIEERVRYIGAAVSTPRGIERAEAVGAQPPAELDRLEEDE